MNENEEPAIDAVEEEKPVLYASTQDLGILSDAAWAVAIRYNDREKRFFRRGGLPVRIEYDDNGAPIARVMTADMWRGEVARMASWKAIKKDKFGTEIEVDAKPPIDVIKDMLATPDIPFPVLVRIVEAPVFAPDGSLAATPGYHPSGRVWFAPAPGLEIPPVPDHPTDEDVREARRRILDMLVDFPFIEDADLVHAVGLMLLPFVRDMIQGPTPNHIIESPCPGSGKGLLADTVLMPSVGRNVGVVPEARNDDEWRKRITALLRAGRAAILLDNIVRPLDSGVLAAALTAYTWDDRVLGESEMLTLPVRCAWITTANNPTMSTEIARRSIRIRLDPKVDRPWQRDGFTHPDLRAYATEHRGDLIWACLVLVRAWIDAGQPHPPMRPLGSYEAWSHVIGGILEHAGLDGFLRNLEAFYEIADTEGAMWRAFTEAWWEKYNDQVVGVADLYPIAAEMESMDLGSGKEPSQKARLGKKLGKQRDCVIGRYRIIDAGKKDRAVRWRLVNTKKTIAG